MLRAVSVIVLAVVTALASPAAAEIYRWVDEHGRVNFDDDLARVPEAQREGMKVYQSKTRPAAADAKEGPRQAAFARALARDLGLQRTDTQDPVSVLQVVGIYPASGWHPTGALTPAVVDEVVRTTIAAARARRLPQSPFGAEAAALRAAEGLGVAAPPPTIAEPPPPPPPAPAPVPIVLAPNIVVEAPPAVVVNQTPAHGYFIGSTDPTFAYGVPFRSSRRRGRRLQTPVARIPPLSHPSGHLKPPVIQPLQARPFTRPFDR